MSLASVPKQTFLIGPWGGLDGFYWDDGVHSTIRQLEISHGTAIDSIRIEYDSFGKSVWSEKHGGNGGFKVDKVKLDCPDEYLTSLHGHYGSLQESGQDPMIIRSLTLVSNRRTYGPFGVKHGVYFTVPQMSGKIVGFLGKAGWFLDALGVYVEPIHNPAPSNAIYHSQQYVAHGTHERVEYSMIHGSLGPDYDLIVAVKQKDARKGHQPNGTSRPTICELSSPSDLKNEIAATNPPGEVPTKIERLPSIKVEGVTTYGPWGGSGGSLFDDGYYCGVREIKVSRNYEFVSIRVCYDQNGQAVWGRRNGGKGAFKSDKIVFDYPSEVLTHVTGHYGPAMLMGPNVIKSLRFHTTKGCHGPYGEEEGEFFSTKEGTVVGFHGRTGLFLDAIGVHVLETKTKPISSPSKNATVSSPSNPQKLASNLTPKPNHQNKGDNSQWPFKIGKNWHSEQISQRLVKDPAPYGPGPWGGEGGKPWDDGVFTGIRQIILTKTTDGIISCIEIEYDRNGQSVWSVKHGGGGATGQTSHRVKLDFPHEVLTSVSGYYGPVRKELQGGEAAARVIRSLTFHSSRKCYGPFGEEMGSYFASGTTEGKVVGFHGRSSMYLDAVGVHMQHWLGNHKSYKPPTLRKIFS